jgi:hypothetical protein
MLAQMFVAFGQGAGQLPVSDSAVQVAVRDYGGKIAEGGDWESYAPTVLGIAKIMGQAAAEYALRNGRLVITAEDYNAARTMVHTSQGEASTLVGFCPWDRA